MPLRNPSRWWRQTRLRSWLAAAMLAGLAVTGVVFAANPAKATLFSIPLTQLLPVIMLPFAIAVAVSWFGARQEKLDRDHSVWEGR